MAAPRRGELGGRSDRPCPAARRPGRGHSGRESASVNLSCHFSTPRMSWRSRLLICTSQPIGFLTRRMRDLDVPVPLHLTGFAVRPHLVVADRGGQRRMRAGEPQLGQLVEQPAHPPMRVIAGWHLRSVPCPQTVPQAARRRREPASAAIRSTHAHTVGACSMRLTMSFLDALSRVSGILSKVDGARKVWGHAGTIARSPTGQKISRAGSPVITCRHRDREAVGLRQGLSSKPDEQGGQIDHALVGHGGLVEPGREGTEPCATG
ncbi:hypothetical protein LX15_000296 [Streptoalloteichus tenebrarius]|uniref:Uncharacterized protein n=1 Tax=Streptoalloteichus tenebrarius (strain ATCC 17920 / DSM 40477 / JCM 4838 / CBS 697.72 / NBRC 16177 / NCIMB 11028 / NRRL B-12390 / A12253. 1 / ISP 5477) TaxID=1933 RepID=A0ABT1HM67_STRSD|nr:hypothetical protein [Streptoalloteichus tenebrarius]